MFEYRPRGRASADFSVAQLARSASSVGCGGVVLRPGLVHVGTIGTDRVRLEHAHPRGLSREEHKTPTWRRDGLIGGRAPVSPRFAG